MIVMDDTPSVEELLGSLVAIPSVNPMGRTPDPELCFEQRIVDWLENQLRSPGILVERWDAAPGRPNLIARFHGGSDRPTILLDAHTDTVPVDGMTVRPFEARRDGPHITGRGACDVKGGLAAMLQAFCRLCLEHPPTAANVVFSATCDEEATTLGIHSLIEHWSSGRSAVLPRRPDYAIIAEPTELDVVVAHRGVVRQRLRTSGRACHSSEPSRGINAIYHMARIVTRLEDYAARLPTLIDPHPLCGAATLSVGRIDGGVSVNIVPESCAIEIDRRLVPGETFEGALQALREFVLAEVPGPIEFETPWIRCPPLSDATNGPLAGALLAVTAPVAGPRRRIGVPFGTHAAYTGAAGVPSVVFGPGSIAQAHTQDEFIDASQLQAAADIYYRLCAHGAELLPA